MFLGQHPHGLDDKGRLVLPSSFRTALKDGGVIAPWNRCIAMWTTDGFQEVAQVMTAKLSDGDGDMDLLGLFFADAPPVKPDAQGRFVVPELHRRYAGLERDTLIVGHHTRLEIWDRDRFGAVHDEKRPALTGMIREMRL